MISSDEPENSAKLYPGKGGFLIAELPYKGGDLAMAVIAPQDIDGLPDVEAKITGDKLRDWFGKLAARKINVQMPKFELPRNRLYDERSTQALWHGPRVQRSAAARRRTVRRYDD